MGFSPCLRLIWDLKMTAAGVFAVFEAYMGPVRSTLVKQQFEDGGQQADAAFAALAALNSYNRTNKLATLHELVRRLIDGDEKVHATFRLYYGPLACKHVCIAGTTALCCLQYRHSVVSRRRVECLAFLILAKTPNSRPKSAVQAMPAVETLLDGLDFNDDAAVVLDQALGPLLSTMSSGSDKVHWAVSLGRHVAPCPGMTPAAVK